ncbi:hypothetical protein [uncultured Hymenobacter sp.]|uniref:hypothetical protein n=1 Tax=uncultured Hymenobacter sp. TaxID=170016 RepID=UPI0035CAAB72
MRSLSRIVWAIPALLIFSCSTLEDPSLVEPEQVLQLTVQGKTELLGNGKDKTALIARLPKGTTQQEVTFTTSGGSFVFNNLKTIKQFADSVNGGYCYTRTVLKTDTTKGVVYIIAETPNARRQKSVTFIR